jgi:hypothetical protein
MSTDDAQQPSDQQVVQQQAEVRTHAQWLWNAASATANRHAYAALWGVNAERLKVYRGELAIDGVPCDGALLMPMRDTAGTVWNVGFITAIGTARFLPGGRIANTYFGWGTDRSTIIVCRSFAKAAEINTATGHAVAVAFTAENVQNVVGIMRTKYPAARVVPATDFQFVSQRGRGETVTDTASAAAPDGAVALTDLESARDTPGRPRSPDRARAPLPVADLAPDPGSNDAPGRCLIPDSPYAKKLLAWIKRKGLAEFTRKKVLQLGPSCVRNAEAAKAALLTLVEQGYLITEDANRYRATSAVQSLREGSLKALKANLGTAATQASANGATAEAATAPATVAEQVATDALATAHAGDSP